MNELTKGINNVWEYANKYVVEVWEFMEVEKFGYAAQSWLISNHFDLLFINMVDQWYTPSVRFAMYQRYTY